MTQESLREVRGLLESRRGELRKLYQHTREAQVEVSGSVSGGMDLVDSAEREEETARTELLASGEVAELEAVEAALQRIREGRYGDCRVCNEPIAADRLHAIPETTLCIACARADDS